MTRKLTQLAVATAVACGAAGAAQADSPGVYFRVDTGYSWAMDAKIKDKAFTPAAPFICADPGCTAPGQLNHVGSSWIAGAGVGYRFTDILRSDLTFGWRGGYKLSGFDGQPASYSANITTYNLMLNGYVDVPLGISWFKPYAGGGLGAARNNFTQIYATGPLGTTLLPARNTTDFAWQLSIGVGFQLSKSLILDVGYRYMDSGKIESGSGATVGAVAVPYNGATGNLTSNELQVGLRF